MADAASSLNPIIGNGPTEALNTYLARSRQAVTIEGAQAAYHAAASNRGVPVLALHGWGASAESMRFLAHGLAGKGHPVLAPTLPGHGTDPTDMMRYGPTDWIAAGREALRVLANQHGPVVLLGVSMGGALALQLAALDGSLVAGVVTLNAALDLSHPTFAFDVMNGPANGMLGPWSGPGFFGPAVPEITYPVRTRKSGADLLTMMALAQAVLSRVDAPTLVLHSRQDPLVPAAVAQRIHDGVASRTKALTWLHQSFHMAQLDVDRDEVVRLAAKFIAAHTRTSDGRQE